MGPAVYVANHQTNWDIIVLTGAVQPGIGRRGQEEPGLVTAVWHLVLSVGQHSDRSRQPLSRHRYHSPGRRQDPLPPDLHLDVPGGPRSRGRGLLPFKTGAFHTACKRWGTDCAVVATSYAKQIDLNRWDNGEVHVRCCRRLIRPAGSAIRWECADHVRELMKAKLQELDHQVHGA